MSQDSGDENQQPNDTKQILETDYIHTLDINEKKREKYIEKLQNEAQKNKDNGTLNKTYLDIVSLFKEENCLKNTVDIDKLGDSVYLLNYNQCYKAEYRTKTKTGNDETVTSKEEYHYANFLVQLILTNQGYKYHNHKFVSLG